MSAEPPVPRTCEGASRRDIRLAAMVLIVAGVVAYANSFRGAFVYDDIFSIVDNPTIRQLWPLTEPLHPPKTGLPIDGRPLVNLSLALNYAWGGISVTSYHAVNLAIHVFAALTLFGCVRRTLLQAPLRERFGAGSLLLATAIALAWLLHPLQTESVTYVVQRAESLMGLFYLLTLYGAIRAMENPAAKRWPLLAIGSCACGMATKEVMVTAPLLVWIYDAVFVTGTFGAALRARRGLYAGLAASWLLLAWLVSSAGTRGGTAGVDAPIKSAEYAIMQLNAIAHYLRLGLWPHPLVFDYGIGAMARPIETGAAAAVVIAGLATTAVGIYRRHWPGFLGCWFFAILAPSSSVVPIATETIAEHRMYLSLAALIAALYSGVWLAAGRRGIAVALATGLALLGLTTIRNRDYQSEETLWRDTVAKRPENPRARFNFGVALFQTGKTAEAAREYREAIRLRPDFASAHSKLARALFEQGELAGAKKEAGEALRLNPHLAEAHATLGGILFREGRAADALPHYREAVTQQPADADLRNNLGTALSAVGQLEDAVREYEAAVRLRPAFAVGHFHLGNTFARLGRFAAAAEHYEAALRIQPGYKAAQDNLTRVRALERNPIAPR